MGYTQAQRQLYILACEEMGLETLNYLFKDLRRLSQQGLQH